MVVWRRVPAPVLTRDQVALLRTDNVPSGQALPLLSQYHDSHERLNPVSCLDPGQSEAAHDVLSSHHTVLPEIDRLL